MLEISWVVFFDRKEVRSLTFFQWGHLKLLVLGQFWPWNGFNSSSFSLSELCFLFLVKVFAHFASMKLVLNNLAFFLSNVCGQRRHGGIVRRLIYVLFCIVDDPSGLFPSKILEDCCEDTNQNGGWMWSEMISKGNVFCDFFLSSIVSFVSGYHKCFLCPSVEEKLNQVCIKSWVQKQIDLERYLWSVLPLDDHFLMWRKLFQRVSAIIAQTFWDWFGGKILHNQFWFSSKPGGLVS